MFIDDLFSKRQRRERGELPDVYSYHPVPQALRVQVVHILRDITGWGDHRYRGEAKDIYTFLHNTLAREYGKFELAKGRDYEECYYNFILNEADSEKVVDAIETAVRLFLNDHLCYEFQFVPRVSIENAIEELNARFRENGMGFRCESGRFLKISSQVVHVAVVQPALALLNDPIYQGANEEYLRAHEHFRHGRFEECRGLP